MGELVAMYAICLRTTVMSEPSSVPALLKLTLSKSSTAQPAQPPTPGQQHDVPLGQPIVHELQQLQAAIAGSTGKLIKPRTIKTGMSLSMRIVASFNDKRFSFAKFLIH
jgi:hypothetical protein